MEILKSLETYRNCRKPFFQPVYSAYATRLLHVEEGPGKNLPFKITSKHGMAMKILLFFGVGFSIPFLSCYWQLRKSKT